MTIVVSFMLPTASDEYDKRTGRRPEEEKEKEEERKRRE